MKTPKELRAWVTAKKPDVVRGTFRKYTRTVDEAHELAEAAEAFKALDSWEEIKRVMIERRKAEFKVLLFLIAGVALISLLTSCNPLTKPF